MKLLIIPDQENTNNENKLRTQKRDRINKNNINNNISNNLKENKKAMKPLIILNL